MRRRVAKELRDYESLCSDPECQWWDRVERLVPEVEDELKANFGELVSVFYDEHIPMDEREFTVRMRGVRGSPTFNFYHTFIMTFPRDYPFKPFKLKAVEFMFHPKATSPFVGESRTQLRPRREEAASAVGSGSSSSSSSDGEVFPGLCCCTLQMLRDDWSPALFFPVVLLSLRRLLFVRASELDYSESFCRNRFAWELLKDGKFDEYDAKVLECCEMYCEKAPEMALPLGEEEQQEVEEEVVDAQEDGPASAATAARSSDVDQDQTTE